VAALADTLAWFVPGDLRPALWAAPR
jgi:hypothetical protein